MWRSNSFEAPSTGRLAVAVWLRIADREQQPPLRLAVEARVSDAEYFRYAALGAKSGGVLLGEQWGQYIFQIDDLPTDNIADVRVRLDLVGAGEVWVDDVQVFDLAFSENERVELSKLITLASYKLQAGQVADCSRILTGYWPKFLVVNVPLVPKAPVLAQRTKADAASTRPAPAKKPDRMEQLKGYLPKWPQF